MTDTERLDWLQRRWASVYASTEHTDNGQLCSPFYHWCVVDERARTTRRGNTGKTLRDAIDAAIARSADGLDAVAHDPAGGGA